MGLVGSFGLKWVEWGKLLELGKLGDLVDMVKLIEMIERRVSQSFLLPVNANWESEISCDNELLSERPHEYFLLSFYSKL